MLIAIPTMGRADKQVTLKNMQEARVKNVVLCPPEDEVAQYEKANPGALIVPVPKKIKGIAATREWMLTDLPRITEDGLVCMLDDDMDFCFRPDMKSTKLETIHGRKLVKLVELLERWLARGKFVHVGISARQGNNHVSDKFKDCTRMMNAYAYDTRVVRRLVSSGDLKLNRVPVMEDFDLTLQLLSLGYPNRVTYEYCWNQRGSGREGGCSSYRTPEVQRLAAKKLEELHPGLVKVVRKKSKTGWKGLEERYDVIVQWKKAWEQRYVRQQKDSRGTG